MSNNESYENRHTMSIPPSTREHYARQAIPGSTLEHALNLMNISGSLHTRASLRPFATTESMVKQFHRVFNHPIGESPAMPNETMIALRMNLIEEELDELRLGIKHENIVEIADAIGDLVYVLVGFAIVCGIPFHEVFREIHASNMTKLGTDGEPIVREDGKILKGPFYMPPDIKLILETYEARHG